MIKYWGLLNRMNLLMLIAFVLGPHSKLRRLIFLNPIFFKNIVVSIFVHSSFTPDLHMLIFL